MRFKPVEKINKTYIVPTLYGFSFAVLVLIMLFMAFMYANNLIYAAVFFVISLSIQNMVRTAKNVENFELIFTQDSPLFAREDSQLKLKIAPKKLKNLYFINIESPLFTKKIFFLEHAGRNKKNDHTVEILAARRGELEVGKIQIQSDFPFGFFKSWKILQPQEKILVYPEKKGSSIFNHFKNKIDFENKDDFQFHEEYQSSSPRHRIDWRVYARTRELYVRNFADEKVFNIDFDWEDVSYLANTEDRVSQLSLWIYEAHLHNLEYSLKLPHRYFAPSKSDSHYHECLKELALWNPVSQLV